MYFSPKLASESSDWDKTKCTSATTAYVSMFTFVGALFLLQHTSSLIKHHQTTRKHLHRAAMFSHNFIFHHNLPQNHQITAKQSALAPPQRVCPCSLLWHHRSTPLLSQNIIRRHAHPDRATQCSAMFYFSPQLVSESSACDKTKWTSTTTLWISRSNLTRRAQRNFILTCVQRDIINTILENTEKTPDCRAIGRRYGFSREKTALNPMFFFIL